MKVRPQAFQVFLACSSPLCSTYWALAFGGPFTYLIKSYSALLSRSCLLLHGFFCHCLLHVPFTSCYWLFSKCAIHVPASCRFLLLSFCSCCFLYLECSSPFFSFWWDPIHSSRPSSNNPLFCESFPDLFKQSLVASSALYLLSYDILLHSIGLIFSKCTLYFLSVLYTWPLSYGP